VWERKTSQDIQDTDRRNADSLGVFVDIVRISEVPARRK
jgi:hypothetical protein